MRYLGIWMVVAISGALVLAGCGGGGASGGATDASGGNGGAARQKIFVAMSFSGNDWQSESSNLALSIARMGPNASKYEVKRDIAGDTVQAQISQYQSMIAAGAKAIVSFPISPTGLNGVIRQGCKQGVIFVMYTGTVTEPCAWNVSWVTAAPSENPGTRFWGTNTAEALVKMLHGKGNILLNRGVAGVSVEAFHTKAAEAVFSKYPGIHVVGSYYGDWSAPTSQQETAKALASHPNVDGVWSQDGQDGVVNALKAKGLKVPVTGEASNSFRLELAHGQPGVSAGDPADQAGVAMKVAIKLLEDGKDSVPKNIDIPFSLLHAGDIKVCNSTGDIANCDAFTAGTVPNQFVPAFYDPKLFPEGSVKAALTGKAPAGTKSTPLPDMKKYAQPPEYRYITRGTCDSGWMPTTLVPGIQGCTKK